MYSYLINTLAAHTKQTKQILNEVTEFRALKTEIDKARCIFEFDAEGTIIHVNNNGLTALGYSAADLLGQHHRNLLARAENTSPEYEAFWVGLQRGESQNGQFKLQSKVGDAIWFQGYYAPVMTVAGKLRKVVAYLTDVSLEKSKSITLQAEEDGANSIFGMLELSLDMQILNVNELSVKSLGYARSELVGKNLSVFMHPADRDGAEFKAQWDKVKAGQPQTCQVRRIAKDGRELWFLANYFPLKALDGKVEKVIVYTSCITAEKSKSADYESQLKAISDIQAVIEFTLDGTVVKANDNFLKTMGYSLDEVVGKHHSLFVAPEEVTTEAYKRFWKDLAAGKINQGQFKRYAKGGREVWLQGYYNSVYDLDGKPVKVVKYATDITEAVKKEQEVRVKSDEAARVKNILDSTSTNMMMADNDGVIMYINESCKTLMTQSVSTFRKVLPNFDANRIIGHSFDQFHAHPNHQRNLLASLNKAYETTIPVADMFFKLKASPIYKEDGTRDGTSLEWVDVTSERHTELEITSIVEAASKGDLTQRLNSKEKQGAVQKICEGINQLLDSISSVLLQVRDAGETINTASGEISSGNNDLSSRTEQQAANLEETASSMEELASTVKQNAENARQANQLAAAASDVAVKGGQVVGEVVHTMAGIDESSRKIEDIISVIDGIAFQTNILALNAAVEAARAGEQGRGFAVVAGEVRNLAQRSASAAKEIKDLISDSVAKVREGTKLVENAGSTMDEIVSSVKRVTDIMGEISAASIEQSAGIDQVNDAITNMDEVTQQNAALVEEAAAAAESLVEQASHLMEMVGSFKFQGTGNSPVKAQPKVHKVETRSVSQTKPAAKKMAKTGTDDGDWEQF